MSTNLKHKLLIKFMADYTSQFINSYNIVEQVLPANYNNADTLFIADVSTLKTGAGQPFAGTVQYLEFTNLADLQEAVVAGSYIDIFAQSFFINSVTKLNKLVVGKKGAYFINQTQPTTAGTIYRDTINNFILNPDTRNLFMFIACDAPRVVDPNTRTEIISVIEDSATNCYTTHKFFGFEEYAPAIPFTVLDILNDAPTSDVRNGDMYLVGVNSTAGNTFDTHAGEIATYNTTLGWTFYQPIDGDVIFLKNSTIATYTNAGYSQGNYIKYDNDINKSGITALPVLDILDNAPTSGLSDNDTYLVGVNSASGDPFDNHAGEVATYNLTNTTWSFSTLNNNTVIFLKNSTITTYINAGYTQGKLIEHDTSLTSPTITGFLFKNYQYSFSYSYSYASYPVINDINTRNIKNITKVAITRQNESHLGAIFGRAGSLELNQEIHCKEFAGISAFSYNATQISVLEQLKAYTYINDIKAGTSLFSTNDPLFGILEIRDIDYINYRAEYDILTRQKQANTKIEYNENTRVAIQTAIYSLFNDMHNKHKFITTATDNEYKFQLGSGFKSNGLKGGYYIYPSEITDDPAYKASGLMTIKIAWAYTTSVKKFVVEHIIQIANN